MAGYRIHWGCKKPRTLREKHGMWQGHSGVWWTKDLGWDDTPDDWFYLTEELSHEPL